MIAYEFYFCKEDRTDLIGILPERRKDLERITPESIMKWGIIIMGESQTLGNLFFVRVRVKEYPHGVFCPEPAF
jgi:hypothetical protein